MDMRQDTNPPPMQEMSGVEDGEGHQSVAISSLKLVVSAASMALGLWTFLQWIVLMMKVAIVVVPLVVFGCLVLHLILLRGVSVNSRRSLEYLDT